MTADDELALAALEVAFELDALCASLDEDAAWLELAPDELELAPAEEAELLALASAEESALLALLAEASALLALALVSSEDSLEDDELLALALTVLVSVDELETSLLEAFRWLDV